jgi:hypothetical protein
MVMLVKLVDNGDEEHQNLCVTSHSFLCQVLLATLVTYTSPQMNLSWSALPYLLFN